MIIQAAPTPAELAHKAVLETPNLGAIEPGRQGVCPGNGVKDDADKVWAVLKDQATPVPGIVMEANASAMKVVVTQGVKQTDFIVNLQTPVACRVFPAASAVLKDTEDLILTSGVKADTDKLSELFSEPKIPIKKIAIEPLVGVIKVAVSQEAKDARVPDFIVNLKTPFACKEAPPVPYVYGQQSKGEAELDGTYDTFTQVPATATDSTDRADRASRRRDHTQKKVVPVHPKPSAGHPAAHPAH